MNPRRARDVLLALALAATTACGGSTPLLRTPGCLPPADLPDHVSLTVDQTIEVPAPCPREREGAIRGPIRLTATLQGLRVQFGVTVAEYVPGSFRDEGRERDTVVVYPRSTAPGQPNHQLITNRAAGGYTVDDIVPWSVWELAGPEGSFRFTCAIFDAYGQGSHVETRISALVSVTR